MIDIQGDPLGLRVVSADVQDRDALHALAPDLELHASLLLVWLDRGFAGGDPAAFLRAQGIAAELVGSRGRQGFQVEPRRWKVEQTFGCLQHYRRLRVDDEIGHDTSRQMTVLASVFMIGMRRSAPSTPESFRQALKEWRAVATRYQKTARSFLGILCLAASADWLKL